MDGAGWCNVKQSDGHRICDGNQSPTLSRAIDPGLTDPLFRVRVSYTRTCGARGVDAGRWVKGPEG